MAKRAPKKKVASKKKATPRKKVASKKVVARRAPKKKAARRPRKKKDDKDIFKRLSKATRTEVKKRYLEFREADTNNPIRCDNPKCVFHSQPLVWLGQPVGLILDHANGVNHDNRHENLRLLCPNCDSQLATKGGANKGRVKMLSTSTYVIGKKEEKKQYVFVASPMVIKLPKKKKESVLNQFISKETEN